MIREISAGGVVVVKRAHDSWDLAVIEPQTEFLGARAVAVSPSTHAKSARSGKTGSALSAKKKSAKVVMALPKGLVDPGEKPEQTALREVREETGLTAVLITKLADIKYVYVRSWGDGERVFKIVSFYLFHYESGEIDAIAPEMRVEVKRAGWIGLNEAEKKLTYRGEREMVRLARNYLTELSLREDSHAS